MPTEQTLWSTVTEPVAQITLLIVIGALITRVGLRNLPRWRLVGQIVFLVALTVLLLYHGIVPYEVGARDTPLVQRGLIALAKIVWWINVTWSLIGFVRVFLIMEEQPRNGRLIQDLVVGIIYVGALLSVVTYVFDAPVGTLIATSGIFAIILGLAMQSTLSDVFSGIALNLGKPYGIGDWIVLSDGVEGRVVQTDWRATYLLNGANDLVIVPNSDIAKARLTNISSPERTHSVSLRARFVPTTLPSSIAEVMRTAMSSSNSILFTPEPSVQIKALDALAVDLELSFSVSDISKAASARSEVFDLIFRHAKASGLKLAPPPTAAGMAGITDAGQLSTDQRATPLRLLDALPLFESLTEDEKEALAETMARRTYGKDEVVVEQGAVLESLMVIRSGVIAATRHEGHHEIQLGRLAPGDYFGEGGLLMGAAESGTLRAQTLTVVYEISQAGLGTLMRDRPGMADELAAILARRIAVEKRLIDKGTAGAHADAVPSIVARIRNLFRIPHG
ncbi:MAG TPA: mechanosensitive ion channel family protein [Dokdonella sp.]